jgi:hypothetical protein
MTRPPSCFSARPARCVTSRGLGLLNAPPNVHYMFGVLRRPHQQIAKWAQLAHAAVGGGYRAHSAPIWTIGGLPELDPAAVAVAGLPAAQNHSRGRKGARHGIRPGGSRRWGEIIPLDRSIGLAFQLAGDGRRRPSRLACRGAWLVASGSARSLLG